MEQKRFSNKRKNRVTKLSGNKKRKIIQNIVTRKRTYSNSGLKDYVLYNPFKKLRRYYNLTIIDILPHEILQYGVCKFLEIEDVVKLFTLNKSLYKLLNCPQFWAVRYSVNYGTNIKFPINEWQSFYKLTYKDLKGLQSIDDKLIYAVKNNHLSFALKIITDDTFYPKILHQLLKNIIEYCNDTQFIEKIIVSLKKWYPDNVQYYINLGLYYSIEFNKCESCKIFVKYKASINDNGFSKTPLYLACDKGYYEICKFLLENNAIVNDTFNNNTPLFIASSDGRIDIVKLLLQFRADVNIVCNDNTALYMATQNGFTDIVELLCKNWANVNFHDANGATPLYAAIATNQTETVKILIKYKARHDIHYRSRSPLYGALLNGNLDIIKLLIESGANVNHRCLNGFSPFLYAVSKNYIDIVEYMLNHGANMELSTKVGLTPLFIACINKYYNLVEILCKHGAQIDVSDNYGSKLYTDDEVDDTCRNILNKYINKK